MTRPSLPPLPPIYLEQIRRQLATIPHPKPNPASILAPARPIRRPTLRQQSGDTLNGLERAFLAHLAVHKLGEVLTQAITLKIANGCRYTPDFIEVRHGFGLRAYEVKGFMREDAAVKIKVAAALFSWIEFFLVTRSKLTRDWRIERVYPNDIKPEPIPPIVLGKHLGGPID